MRTGTGTRGVEVAMGDGGSRKARASVPLPPIPDKLYFRIGEVATLLAVPAYVLRFWESEFPQLRPPKSGTGQRLYRRRDVEALLEVRQLLYERGFTIPGARQHLQERAETPAVASPTHERPKEAQGNDATVKALRLRQLRNDVRDLAELLGKPTSRAHRGLHVASRRRTAQPLQTPSLFTTSHDREDGPD